MKLNGAAMAKLLAISLVILFLLRPATSAQNKTPAGSQAPLWKLDIRALGYARYAGNGTIGSKGPLGQFSFSEDDRILVTFVFHILSDAPSRRDQPDSLGLRLNALFVNARTGQLQTTQEWSTSSRRSGIIPVTGGNFLIVRPDKLILYSPDLQLLKELEIPVFREALKDDWDLIRSPGGKFLLIHYEPASDLGRTTSSCFEVRDELIDAERLSVVRSWSQFGWIDWESRPGPCLAPTKDLHLYHWSGVSDDGSLLTDDSSGAPAVGHLDSPFDVLCLHSNPNCRGGSFVNNQTVLVWPLPHSDRPITLISTNGEILPIQELEQKEALRSVARSEGGQRLAIYVEKSRGGSEFLMVAPTWYANKVMVYDIPRHKWIYTLDPKKQGITKISELALSPDGTLLALVDQNGILQVYRVAEK